MNVECNITHDKKLELTGTVVCVRTLVITLMGSFRIQTDPAYREDTEYVSEYLLQLIRDNKSFIALFPLSLAPLCWPSSKLLFPIFDMIFLETERSYADGT